MTGSTDRFSRQHSVATGDLNVEKKSYPRIFRRCSSVDDNNDNKEILFLKRERGISDIDSGTEDNEQQIQSAFKASFDDDDEDKLSTKSSGINFDEGFSECETQQDPQLIKVQDDLMLAKNIPDEIKKDFCPDASVAFHGEFARLISIPLSLYHNVRYYLFAEDEILGIPNMNITFHYLKVDNAKAQFKCSTPGCGHAWTSMRARISFSISQPHIGFIVLRILGQNCQRCGGYADALWYIDEICRVMKNLAKSVFENYFPDMLHNVDLEGHGSMQHQMKPIRHPRHDPTQRKGRMLARHVKEFCEACQRGLCFPENI